MIFIFDKNNNLLICPAFYLEEVLESPFSLGVNKSILLKSELFQNDKREQTRTIFFNGEKYSRHNFFIENGIKNFAVSFHERFAAVVPIFFNFKNFSFNFDDEDISKLIGYTEKEVNAIGFQKLVVNLKKVSMKDLLLSRIPEKERNDFSQTEYKLKNKLGGQSIVLEFVKKIKTETGMFVGHIGFWQFR